MRALAMLLLCPVLAACQPSFDEDYAKAEAELKAEAERLDRELAAQQKPAAPQPE